LISESPTNPYNKVIDLDRIGDIGRRHRSSRSSTRPSRRRSTNSRSRTASTWCCTRRRSTCRPQRRDRRRDPRGPAMIDAIRDCQGVLGGIIDPHAAYLISAG
jgi:cystathionine gamma-synthase